MTVVQRYDAAVAARVAALGTCLVAVVAIAVHLAAARAVREWLGFEFAGVPRQLDEAVAIFVNNARLLAAVLVACVVAQKARPEPDSGLLERGALRLVRGACDLTLLAGAAFHVAFVGAAVGAYGFRTVAALLPHGPLELGGFALAIGLYLSARRGQIARGRAVGVVVTSLAALAAAALIEVFLQTTEVLT